MKELRFFYVPEASASTELPSDEAGHAVRVLRLGMGDEIFLMDGCGSFYRATITAATNHRCAYRIEEVMPQEPAWQGHLHLAMAPTKMMDRVEWFVEKATEIGFDELTFLDCHYSERRVVKPERIDKILVSAMKQSRKAWKPQLNGSGSTSRDGLVSFRDFVTAERDGDKFICHCHRPDRPTPNPSLVGRGEVTSSVAELYAPLPTRERSGEGPAVPFLFDVLRPGVPSTVLIGPEGDFSLEEVELALAHGYQSVSLGRSRLRTETAALAAVHMMQLRNGL